MITAKHLMPGGNLRLVPPVHHPMAIAALQFMVTVEDGTATDPPREWPCSGPSLQQQERTHGQG